MARPEEAYPVKLFVAALWGHRDAFDRARQRLEEEYGPTDYEGPAIEFDVTDYYAPEMGQPLYRTILSIEKTISPDTIVAVKLFTNLAEDELAQPSGRRTVNLDPGYMDFSKVVLPSAKYGAQKIYLGRGIWADPTLRYSKGRFYPFEWTFPDFKDSRYETCLLRIRELYKTRKT